MTLIICVLVNILVFVPYEKANNKTNYQIPS